MPASTYLWNGGKALPQIEISLAKVRVGEIEPRLLATFTSWRPIRTLFHSAAICIIK
jgi:hypothetical protein